MSVLPTGFVTTRAQTLITAVVRREENIGVSCARMHHGRALSVYETFVPTLL